MKYQELISRSKQVIGEDFPLTNQIMSFQVFEIGSRWMHKKLFVGNEQQSPHFNPLIKYRSYGLFKYSIAFGVFFVSLWQLLKISVYIAPLSIILFYLVEVHFVFLFPIILEEKRNPLWVSIQQTYKMGIINALFTLVPIGFFMVYGLLNIKDPFRNWYIGCLSIVIWYQDEVRNRL